MPPVQDPPRSGFDAIAAQVLGSDPEELHRRASAFAAVVTELESVRDGLQRESRRVADAMDGSSAEAFESATGTKIAVLGNSIGTLNAYAPALRRAGDELARSRTAMTELQAQRAIYMGTPQAAAAEQAFTVAAQQILDRLGVVFRSTGAALTPLSAVPTGTAAPAPAATADPVVPAGASVTTPAASFSPGQAPWSASGVVRQGGAPGLTAPGPEAVAATEPGSTASPPGVVASEPGIVAGQTAGAHAGPFAMAGGVLGAPLMRGAAGPAVMHQGSMTQRSGMLQPGALQSGTPQSGAPQSGTLQPAVVPSGTLQSAPVVARSATLRSATVESQPEVLGRPAGLTPSESTPGIPGVLPAATTGPAPLRRGRAAGRPADNPGDVAAFAASRQERLASGAGAVQPPDGVLGRPPNSDPGLVVVPGGPLGTDAGGARATESRSTASALSASAPTLPEMTASSGSGSSGSGSPGASASAGPGTPGASSGPSVPGGGTAASRPSPPPGPSLPGLPSPGPLGSVSPGLFSPGSPSPGSFSPGPSGGGGFSPGGGVPGGGVPGGGVPGAGVPGGGGNWPVRPLGEELAAAPTTPQTSGRSGSSVSPAAPGAGGAPMGHPFMPMGGMGAGMAGGGGVESERERGTALTEDPSAWADDGVPGVLGRPARR